MSSKGVACIYCSTLNMAEVLSDGSAQRVRSVTIPLSILEWNAATDCDTVIHKAVSGMFVLWVNSIDPGFLRNVSRPLGDSYSPSVLQILGSGFSSMH